MQTAVDSAPINGTVKIAGNCPIAPFATQVVSLTQNITLSGGYTHTNWLATPDPTTDPTTLDGLDQGQVVVVASGVDAVLENLIIQNGYTAADGAGIYSAGTLTIKNSIISDNNADNDGGGIKSSIGSTLLITGTTTITNNHAIQDGGGIDSSGDLTMFGGQLSFNTSRLGVGLMSQGSASQLTTVTMHNNEASFEGGGHLSFGDFYKRGE